MDPRWLWPWLATQPLSVTVLENIAPKIAASPKFFRVLTVPAFLKNIAEMHVTLLRWMSH